MMPWWSAEVIVLSRYWRQARGLRVQASHAGLAASRAIEQYLRALPKRTRVEEIRVTLRRLGTLPPPADGELSE